MIPIIFDLDGTLWDSVESVMLAWNKGLISWSEEFEEPLRELSYQEVQGIMGLAFDDIFLKLFPQYDSETRAKLGLYLEEFESDFLNQQGGVLYPGVDENLSRLGQNHSLGIISNCQAGYIEIFLKVASQFPIVDFKSHGATQLSKGENILNMCHEQGWAEVIYLGDTSTDMNACEWVNAQADAPLVHFHLAAWGFGADSIKNQVSTSNTWSSFTDFAEYYK